ncbi:SDR family NAD(P)-dependent oxidoreductase [Advenella sp. RU8]|uniref:SDR family NAD(P)-dependent oxidoreductase n=1 Tax=Advenella sp. RU8 TaxID=3399575 RepID=UPI003AAF19D9
MQLQENMSALVTGGASGLGLATVEKLLAKGMDVVIVDLNDKGQEVANQLGGKAHFVKADVCDPVQMKVAVDKAVSLAPLRALVNCAGYGGPIRLVEKDGEPGSLEKFEAIIRVNVIGTFNSLRLATAAMAKNEPIDNERGACVLTASVAAYEGQIGQIAYSAGKAGIVGMTLVAARDLAQRQIRVNTIAPGLFDTPLLARLPEHVKSALGASVPHPARLGYPAEFASLAQQMLENAMLNGETIRLDGAIRMAPR